MNKNRRLNVAIFGGSFDPPHTGHIKIVEKSLEILDIDKLFVIPTYLNPFKKSFYAPSNLRYRWLKEIFENNKKVEIVGYEMEQKKAVATIETVKYLYKKYNIEKMYIIIGADNLPKLHKWKDFKTLKKLATFVIATRDEQNIPENLINLEISANISSSKLREKMNEKFLPSLIKDEIIRFYKESNEQKD